jgi:chromate reductase
MLPVVSQGAPVKILLISGSDREGSTNAAVMRTAAQVAPGDVETVLYPSIGELPLFNPDNDREGVPVDPRVAEMRRDLAACDALLISTPEYAGAMPAAMKNLLEWTIGDAGTYRKPTAWINAAGAAAPTGAADAHESLRKVLGYAGADIVEDACVRIPVERALVSDGIIGAPEVRDQIAAVVRTLADHAAAAREA